MIDGELIDSVAGLEALSCEWDDLAAAASNPVAAPAWVLPWCRHVADADLQPRAVAVRDRGALVGLVPLYLASSHRGVSEYRMMAADFGVCVEPLTLPGREWDVAGELARVLADCEPHPDILAFGPMSLASNWTLALTASWPGRVPGLARHYDVQGAPVIVLRDSSLQEWWASLSSKARGNLRRSQRRFEEVGGVMRWTTAATLRKDAETFARLHAARWAGRGWSRLAELGHSLPDWLEDVGRGMIDKGRFGMCVHEVDGSPVCVDFHLLAGEELAAVNMGWDERYAKLAPARLAGLRLVERAAACGCRRLRLGRGEHESKLCLANGNDPVACSIFMPPSARLPNAYAHALPALAREHARDFARRALPPRWFDATRSVRHRAAPGTRLQGPSLRRLRS